jgi:YbbR domain-containing protein
VVIDTAPLAKMQAGERTFELTGAQVRTPAGVEVVQVIPSSVRLSFDKRVYRDLEVRPRVMGSFAPGYKIKSVWSEPAKVSVVGPEKHVNSVDAAMTDAIDASGVVGEQKFPAVPYVQDPMVRLARPTTVSITVVMEKTK